VDHVWCAIGLSLVLVACDNVPTSTPDGSADVVVVVVDASPDAHVGTCTVGDAALAAAYTTTPSRGCPSAWSELVGDGGWPSSCPTEGVLCVYPQGQAACMSDGTNGLRWLAVPLVGGCGDHPPTQCSTCNLKPGSICQYLNKASHTTDAILTFCCDGTNGAWDLFPDGGCPNGNTCGTIHASDYDRSCTTASDCVAVVEGDMCKIGCTDCVNAAVNYTVSAQYESDFESKVSVHFDCPCPGPFLPVCEAGVCGVSPP
jgi:hypothetical protein